MKALLLALVLAMVPPSQRVDLADRVEVDVLSKFGDVWVVRKAQVHKFSDGRIVACVEYKDKVIADCLVIVDDGTALLLPVRLIEEKI